MTKSILKEYNEIINEETDWNKLAKKMADIFGGTYSVSARNPEVIDVNITPEEFWAEMSKMGFKKQKDVKWPEVFDDGPEYFVEKGGTGVVFRKNDKEILISDAF